MKAEFHGVLRRAGTLPRWADGFASGVPPANVETGSSLISAGWSWRRGDVGIAARRAPVLWCPSRGEHARWTDERGTALHDGLWRRAMLPATDDPVLLWAGERCVLRSSIAGGSVVYWTVIGDGIAFAQAIPLLEPAQQAPLDQVGFAEVARFGGSYSERTILQGVRRIPFGHELEFVNGVPVVRPFATFDAAQRAGDAPDMAMGEIRHRLAQLLEMLPERRHVMFSGGVDSSVLAALGVQSGRPTTGVNLALRADDPEADVAADIAARMGLDVRSAMLQANAIDVERTIASYASPTLDFSIIPTHQVGALARGDGARTLVDGTGGDAWFGFGALRNESVWRRIHRLYPVRRAAAQAYGRVALLRDTRWLAPLKAVARAPRRADAAMAHMCASPLYDVVWSLESTVWEAAEAEVAGVLDALIPRTQSPWQRMVVADGTFIASGAFAAKSGQWSMVRDLETVYPFLTPGLVDIARGLRREQLIDGNETKPLLKALAVSLGIRPADIFRRKSGFQPPLAALMRNEGVGKHVEAAFARRHELDDLMTPMARRIIRHVLQSDRRPTIHVLYPFWNLLSMRLWLDAVRDGRARAEWCR